MAISRRTLLTAAGSSALAAGFPHRPAIAQGAPIKLGSILDNSGNLDIYGKPMVMATAMAVEELNAAGGLLGRKIELIQYDTPVRHRALHQVRPAADARGQGRRRAWRHHVGVARGDPPDLPARQHALFLQRAVRRRRVRPQLHGHRHDAGAGGRADDRARHEEVGQQGLHARRRLQLRPDHRQVGRSTMSSSARAPSLKTDFFPLDVADFGSTIAKIQEAAPNFVVVGPGRRRAPVVLPAMGRIRHEQEDPARLHDLRRRQRAPRALAGRRRRHPDRRQLQPGDRHAGQQGLPGALAEEVRRHQDRARDRRVAVPGHHAVGRMRQEGGLARPRRRAQGDRIQSEDRRPGRHRRDRSRRRTTRRSISS